MNETEPTPGVEPDHTAYEAGARPSRSMGTSARGLRVRGASGAQARCSEEFSPEWRSLGFRLTVECLAVRRPLPGRWVGVEPTLLVRVGPLPKGRELQRKESNLRDDRLTAGCLTIRLRWKKSARRGCGAKCSANAVEPVAPSFQGAWGRRASDRARLGSGHRIRTCVSGFRDQRPAS